MSSVDVAVGVLRELESEDLRVLMAIEFDMSHHRYVPEKGLSRLTGSATKHVEYRLGRLNAFGLITRWTGPYPGYILSAAGYDCLAVNALVKADVLKAFGKPLGVGKEADVYDALAPDGERIALKFHRLGRTSFRQTRRVRGYIADRRHISWLYQSRLAAEKEFEALKLVHPRGVSVPKPIDQNRHVVAMGLIEGAELYRVPKISDPEKVLEEILGNVREAYIEAKVVHSDLSEFNVIVKPDGHVLIIDWPQFVRTDHPNADLLLKRDVRNILEFFRKRFTIKLDLQEALSHIKTPEDTLDEIRKDSSGTQ